MDRAWRSSHTLTITIPKHRSSFTHYIRRGTAGHHLAQHLLVWCKCTNKINWKGWLKACKISLCWQHWEFQSVEKGSTPIPCTLMMDPRDEATMAAPQHTFHSNNTVIRSSGTTGQGSVLTSCLSSPSLSTSFSHHHKLSVPELSQTPSFRMYLTACLFIYFSICKRRISV